MTAAISVSKFTMSTVSSFRDSTLLIWLTKILLREREREVPTRERTTNTSTNSTLHTTSCLIKTHSKMKKIILLIYYIVLPLFRFDLYIEQIILVPF